MSTNVIDDSIPSETAVRNIKDIISSAPKCGDEKDTESQDPDMDEQEMIASVMSGDKIKELLSSSGPIVKAVLLKTDGTAEEILYDSTPSKNHVTEILGAPPSILGQYADLDVIVVGARCEESAPKFALNTHKLRYPFNNDSFNGDIFLYRFSQDCVMQDFSLSEYKEFAAKSQDDIGKVFKPAINDKDQVVDEDSVDDEDDEEDQLSLGQDFMREIILKKVRADFPAKFGREPTEEELESYVSGTIQAAGALFGFGAENDEAEDADEEDADSDYDPNEDEQQKVADEKEDLADENELEQELADDADEEDADYDPKEDEEQQVADEEEDLIDEDELEQELEDIENAQNEDNEPSKDVDEPDEKEIVNSQEFENELRAAIENVQHIAKLDKEKILSMARQEYINDTGEEPTQQMVAAAFKMFAIDEDEEENEAENEEKSADIEAAEDAELNAEVFEKEFGEALETVRELGQTHQKTLVDKICQTFGELHGKEPTTEEMCGIFARIQSKLAEEAMEDFIEKNNASDDVENDSDYEPNEEELQQVEEDKKIEVLEDIVTNEQANEEDADIGGVDLRERVKILVTPVKKKAAGSRMGIYLDQPDEKQTLEFASAKFEKINGRAPTEDDTKRLKEFLATGMLFESEINANMFDDEEDEEYLPEKDTEDYSKDIDDEIEFENENAIKGSDENEDTSNIAQN